ncbi:MAG: hypothetical protein QS721_12940 [Candidatus Endonucleobacter sp. (ex Gigantidas childressi)]|nr:hypothetical protein [Candidatus Endonucleobacter sp. (ex Gigantidas childressi)]
MNITHINNMHASIELAEKLAYPSQYDKKDVNITYSNNDGRAVTVTVPSIFLRGYNSSIRSASFKNSSGLFTQLNIPIEKFASGGFIYDGTSESRDRVQCVRCKGVLKQFVKNDDPAADHQKFFPKCQVDKGNVPIELDIPEKQHSSVAPEEGQCKGIINEFTGKINVSKRPAGEYEEEHMRELKKAKLSMETSLEVSLKPKGSSYGDVELTEDLNGPCCSGISTRVENKQQDEDHSNCGDDDQLTQEEISRRMDAKSWTRPRESLAAFSQAPSNVYNIDDESIPFEDYQQKAKTFLQRNRVDLVKNIAKDKLDTYLDLLLAGAGGIPGNDRAISEDMRAKVLCELTTNGVNSGVRTLLNTCGVRTHAGLYLMLMLYQGKEVLSEDTKYPYPDFVADLISRGIGKITADQAM